jgi:multimeric flavodoxin WrbA
VIGRRIALLDGRQAGDEDLAPASAALSDLLEQAGAEVRTFPLRELKLTHCIGCFGCWLETPGVCCFRDAWPEVAQAIMESDTVVLLGAVSFGSYAPQLKLMVDRFLPTLLPYFGVYHGEVHHRPRYARYPRWVGIGAQRDGDAEEARLFKLLVARNAINFHAPSYAAEVVQSTDDGARLQDALRAALERQDPFPWREPVKSMMPAGQSLPAADDTEAGGGAGAARRALLLVGSPKTKSPSTSGVLGEELLGRLAAAGWQTESRTLRPSTFREAGEGELLAAVDQADLILLAFPLYIDTVPYLVTRALEVIAEHRRAAGDGARPQGLFALANNGFPEAHQNNLAFAVVRRCAVRSGMAWLGAMALGAGEGMIGGRPLEAKNGDGVPLFRVSQALDAAGAALARGEAPPAEAVQGMASVPIPYMPRPIWHRLFMKGAGSYWEKQAAGHGVSKADMLGAPHGAPAR